jgi:hypothetical protein
VELPVCEEMMEQEHLTLFPILFLLLVRMAPSDRNNCVNMHYTHLSYSQWHFIRPISMGPRTKTELDWKTL